MDTTPKTNQPPLLAQLVQAISGLLEEIKACREDRIEQGLARLMARFATQQDLTQMEQRLMAKLDDIVADVTAETTLIEGVSTLVTGLKQQLADALTGENLSPEAQAKVDQIFATAEANKAKLAAALADNTPAATAQA